MTAAVLTGYVLVPLLGVLMCIAPAATRPTLQFGVRVPPAHTTDEVIRRERHGYRWRTASGGDRDDDRFWKAGLIYVNRDDPAILVSARFGVGWTPNLGNPTARLLVAGVIAVPAGLMLLRIATGL